MNKRILSSIFVVLLLVASVFSVQAADLEPPVSPDPLSPYTGVTSAGAGLSRLNNGNAQVTGSINLKPGYRANATLALYKEGSTSPVASWSQSSTFIWISQSYSVPSGYTYYVSLAATVYDSNDNYVDSVNIESNHVHF